MQSQLPLNRSSYRMVNLSTTQENYKHDTIDFNCPHSRRSPRKSVGTYSEGMKKGLCARIRESAQLGEALAFCSSGDFQSQARPAPAR